MSPPPPGDAGGAESRIDLDAVERFGIESSAVRLQLRPVLANLRPLDDDLRAGWGAGAPAGTALDDLARLLAGFEAHEIDVAAVHRHVVAADRNGWVGPTPGSLRSLAGGGAVRASGVVHLDVPAATGRLNPWLDPGTDSWVVNLARAPLGLPPTPAFARRVVRQGPGVVGPLLRTSLEFQTISQLWLAATDPGRFAANWARAGRGAAEAMAATAMMAIGTQALTTAPWIDEIAGRTIGRRPGRELLSQLGQGVALLGTDPDALGRATVGWDDLQADPYHWLGGFAPDVVLEILTGLALGRGATAARAGTRAAEAAQALEAMEAVEIPTRLNGAPGRRGWHRAVGGSTVADPPPRPLPDLAQFRRAEPEWAEAGPIVSHRQAPFEPPEDWVAHLNGEGAGCAPGRRVNCIDTTRAVEANWRGHDAVAAPLARPERGGTTAERLEQWSGGRLAPTTSHGIEQRLTELGPGSSALIVTTWDSPGAHAFNAVNDRGVVKWVDAQLGATSTWPPRYASHFDELQAIFIDAGGSPVGGATP